MKRILITGSEGQLGKTFRKISSKRSLGYEFIFTDLFELDITDIESIRTYCKSKSIDFLINCAAYTAVDQAEEDPENAYLINSTGVSNLATVCEELDIFMVHISTDYVFDGDFDIPIEDSVPHPQSVYGASKLSGEEKMKASGVHGIIIRTSWLYSEFGNNFVFTILRLAREREKISVVDDQIGSPTNSTDLAEVILQFLEKSEKIVGCEIFHYSNMGRCSWYEFAKYIVKKKGLTCVIEAISTEEYPQKAKRPHNSVLHKSKMINFLETVPPNWEDSLDKVLSYID